MGQKLILGGRFMNKEVEIYDLVLTLERLETMLEIFKTRPKKNEFREIPIIMKANGGNQYRFHVQLTRSEIVWLYKTADLQYEKLWYKREHDESLKKSLHSLLTHLDKVLKLKPYQL